LTADWAESTVGSSCIVMNCSGSWALVLGAVRDQSHELLACDANTFAHHGVQAEWARRVGVLGEILNVVHRCHGDALNVEELSVVRAKVLKRRNSVAFVVASSSCSRSNLTYRQASGNASGHGRGQWRLDCRVGGLLIPYFVLIDCSRNPASKLMKPSGLV
jgi:hypothetical protein